MKTLIRNGRVIDPKNGRDGHFDVLILDKKVKEIARKIPIHCADEIIDADGLIISPGFIDLHVHLREPGAESKESINSGCAAAAHGGFTAIAAMPNTNPVNDSPQVTQLILDKIQTDASIHVYPVAAVTKGLRGRELVDFEKLCQMGVIGFSNDGRVVDDPDIICQAMSKIKTIGSVLIEHPEEHRLSQNGLMHQGDLTKKHNIPGISSLSEDLIIARDLTVQAHLDSNLHLTHISTIGAFEMIKEAKRRGIRVSADVTPHHLLLNDSTIQLDPLFKVKPPIRTELDRQAMIKGIVEGTIDCIASDHAPHTAEEKNQDISSAPFGISGVETVFPLMFHLFVNKQILTINRLIELLSVAPARILNLKSKGQIKCGESADITILDPKQRFKISPDFFYSKAKHSPFMGYEGRGTIAYTLVEGKVVYRSS